jgi:hypothetical protein
MTENPWHMCLLPGYSETYLPAMPRWFRELLIISLAKLRNGKEKIKHCVSSLNKQLKSFSAHLFILLHHLE